MMARSAPWSPFHPCSPTLASRPPPSSLEPHNAELTPFARSQRLFFRHTSGWLDPKLASKVGFPLKARASTDLDEAEYRWSELESEISFMTRTVRLVQWYPGHIAKAERDLKEQLKLVDVVIEVRDARIPQSTSHPDIDRWIGDRHKLVVLNREDMVSSSDRNAWANFYAKTGTKVLYTDGQHGSGISKLTRTACLVGKEINEKRKKKGLLPRAVRAAVIGFPNVGKSAIINRLLKRRITESAPRPGVTRHVKWHQIGENLDLLDAPGILPARIADQSAAAKLAICNDIGEAAYAVSGVALILVEYLRRMPSAGPQVLASRYKLSPEGLTSEEYLTLLGENLFNGDIDQASHRVLKDYRRGKFGWLALELPPTNGSF